MLCVFVLPLLASCPSPVAMSNPPIQKSRLVQKCITSYFPLYSRHCYLDDLSCQSDSLAMTPDKYYVLETPKSKQGNLAFYLGLRSTKRSCPLSIIRSTEALFEQVVAKAQRTFITPLQPHVLQLIKRCEGLFF